MLRKVMSQILPLELCRKVVSVMLSSSSSSSSSSPSSASLDCESLMTSATNSSFHLPELEKLYFNFSELEKVCFYFSELEKLYFFSELEKLCFYFSGKLSSIYKFELPWQTKRKVLYCDVSFAQGWKTFQWQGEYVPPPQLPYVTSASKPPHSPLAIFSSFWYFQFITLSL